MGRRGGSSGGGSLSTGSTNNQVNLLTTLTGETLDVVRVAGWTSVEVVTGTGGTESQQTVGNTPTAGGVGLGLQNNSLSWSRGDVLTVNAQVTGWLLQVEGSNGTVLQGNLGAADSDWGVKSATLSSQLERLVGDDVSSEREQSGDVQHCKI